MNDFLTGSWAVIFGIATGPIGLFLAAFFLTTTAIVLVAGHNVNKGALNRHVPAPEKKEGP